MAKEVGNHEKSWCMGWCPTGNGTGCTRSARNRSWPVAMIGRRAQACKYLLRVGYHCRDQRVLHLTRAQLERELFPLRIKSVTDRQVARCSNKGSRPRHEWCLSPVMALSGAGNSLHSRICNLATPLQPQYFFILYVVAVYSIFGEYLLINYRQIKSVSIQFFSSRGLPM